MRVFIGKVRETDMGFSSAIFKSEVFGELWLGENGLEGDEQASTKVHERPGKSVAAIFIASL